MTPPDTSQLLDRITQSPDVCHGKPCIRGLRYPVAMILELLSAGMGVDELLADYPDLEAADVMAALAYAAQCCEGVHAHARTLDELKRLDVVALTEDLPAHALRRGQVGTIVEELAPGVYEAEFSDNDGRTYAMLALRADQLLLLHYDAVMAA